MRKVKTLTKREQRLLMAMEKAKKPEWRRYYRKKRLW